MRRSDRFTARWVMFGLFLASLTGATACSFEAGLQPGSARPDAGVPDASTPDASAPEDGGRNEGRFDGGGGNPDGGIDGGDAGLEDVGLEDAGREDIGLEDAGRDSGGQMPSECDGQPVDLNSDPDHCGACGNACDPAFGRCAGGECACEAGLVACGPDARCTDTDADPDHCGACAEACVVGEACVGSQCACRDGLLRCAGECVDPQSDPRHCDSCGTSCGDNACRNATCRGNERCGAVTAPSCEGPDGGQACTGDETNPLHCGSSVLDPCGEACRADEVCVDPGALASSSCVTYRIGRGCTGCPCADCDAAETCFDPQTSPGRAYCLTQ